jgi:hypothetical protein
MTYCPRCSRDVNPLEDEHVLSLLSYMAEDLRLLPHDKGRIVDKVCVAITAYIRGRERRYWEVK